LIEPKECDQQSLRWGDPESLMLCLRLMVEERGMGKILSLGTRAAAEHYGHGSADFAMHVKGLEIAYHDPRATFSMAANYATANRGGFHLEVHPWKECHIGQLMDWTRQPGHLIKLTAFPMRGQLRKQSLSKIESTAKRVWSV